MIVFMLPSLHIIIYMHYYINMIHNLLSPNEIAEILNIPIGTVLWKYQNAITKMKDVIKP
jgi:transposase-like protein